ncbi:MAG: DNA translocase FtsK [Oscillospiraceae bacterium]|nr:DNA translocase FtsK [Oscillospiraceae bacterium]
MPDKLTKAQQAAEPKKKKKMTVEEDHGETRSIASIKKEMAANAAPRGFKGNAAFPLRYAIAAACAIVLLIFVSVLFSDEGLVLQWIVSLVTGLFGRNFYYISIPALIYLICVLLVSRGKPVRGRAFCVIAFVFLFGCASHLLAADATPLVENADGVLVPATGWALLKELYRTGILGTSGGVICGLITNILVKGFGHFFVFSVILILCAVSLMFGAKLDLVGWARRLWTFAAAKVLQWWEDRNEPEYEDYAEEEDEVPGLWNRLWDKVAQKQTERQDRQALEPAKPSLRERTRQMIRDTAPELEPRFEAEPVLPDDPDVFAEVAAEPGEVASVPVKDKVTAKEAAEQAAKVEQEIAAAQAAPKTEYAFPPIDLLKLPRGRAADGTAEMRENTQRLNETLASFKIDAHISNVTRGPSVTRYEVELEKGVRLNKLTTCADDIALSLGASGVRIAPVPGKISVVGIEVPNQTVTNVSLREVIDSPEFNRAKSRSSIAVGKDIGGSCIIGNIAKFPHMLIAGTTGSGKSVCMNSIIISLLYKASPEDVKLIMVDPKMVELGIYNGIPHLLIPVVTDPKKAAGSLQWAVTEMMRRYRSMSDAGVRDLESYNSMIDGGEVEGERLPQVVVIIDELADLMLVAAKEVEESICRIAQMGRAAGIHLIIATQRPSADVITGLMKANIPSRIAFAVASAMESRIILDTQGVEKLVGKGDMLYSPIGSGKPQRVQGCFVTDAEVEAVAGYVKEHFASTYDQAVMDDIERKAEQTGTKGAPATASDPDPSAEELAHDEMLPDAVDVILETKQASVSLLQRRLKLGYARAARIVDEMEEMGIVGPFVGSKPRQILVTKEQWEQMKQGQTIVTQPDEPVPDDDIDIPF